MIIFRQRKRRKEVAEWLQALLEKHPHQQIYLAWHNYLLADKKLSNSALAIFKAAERGKMRLLLPDIVLTELYFANAKFNWFPGYKTVYKDILSKPFFKFCHLTIITIYSLALTLLCEKCTTE